MNSKRSLMTALVGLAMLATPIAAAAHDYNHYDHPAHAARVAAATHPFANHVFGNGAFARHERHEERAIADANAYRNYGRGYGYAAPAYVAPAYTAPVYAAPAYAAPAYASAPYYGGGYGGGGYGGNGCRRAQSVMTNYYKDRNTGHPAAAYDLLRQNQWALNSGCATGAPVMGNAPLGGLLGGLGGYGRPAYNGGYNTGYAQQGYGQPYGGGSMLAPLLGQFGIR